MVPSDGMKPWAFPVFARGAVHAAGTPLVPAEDLGFQLGLALFETLLVERGHVFFEAAHRARLEAAARALGIPWVGAAVLQKAQRSLRQAIASLPGAPERYALRVTLTAGVPGAGPELILQARTPEPFPAEGVAVWISEQRLLADACSALKSTSRLRYSLAKREAQAQGAYEALLFNTDGELAEGSFSNVFLVADGKLRTPPLTSGCLGGILRHTLLNDLERQPLVLEGGRHVEVCLEPLLPSDLVAAEELFLTNSIGRLIPVRRILERGQPARELPAAPGPILLALAQRLSVLEELDRQASLEGYTDGPAFPS